MSRDERVQIVIVIELEVNDHCSCLLVDPCQLMELREIRANIRQTMTKFIEIYDVQRYNRMNQGHPSIDIERLVKLME